MSKHLVVLGNGFDRAHRLPTSYCDIVMSMDCLKRIHDSGTCGFGNILGFINATEGISDSVKECFYAWADLYDDGNNDYAIDIRNSLAKLTRLLENNIWHLYFLKRFEIQSKEKDVKWIDLENEIEDIVGIVEKNYSSSKELITSFIERIPGENDQHIIFKESVIDICGKADIMDFSGLIKRMIDDFDRFKKSMSFYFYHIVDHKINASRCDSLEIIEGFDADCVVNFNYTETYERLYSKDIVCHIHGVIKEDDDLGLVFGISENKAPNLPELYKVFCKRNQRMKNDKSYLKWIGEDITDVTFFGHSLGKTDFDVLRELFSIKSARYKVCYYEESECVAMQERIKLILGSEEYDYKCSTGSLILANVKE